MEHLAYIIVISIQVIVFQFIATAHGMKLIYNMALNKNLEWVKNNPDKLQSTPPSRNIWLHYSMGILFLGGIVCGAIVGNVYIFSSISLASALLLALQFYLIDMPKSKKMDRIIPSKDVRKASLSTRSFRSFFPSKVLKPALALYSITIIGWLLFFVLKENSLKELTDLSRYIFLLVLTTIGMVHTIRRKRKVEDPLMDSQYRQLDLYISGAVQFWAVLCALLKLVYLTLEMTELFVWRDIQLYAALIPISSFVLFLKLSKRYIQLED